jgi:glutamyl-tRNA reductase
VPLDAKQQPREYVIGAGDVLRVAVYQNPDLAIETRVSDTGQISFPLLGQVTVGGLTVPQVEKALADGLRTGNFVKQPQVTVLVTQVRDIEPEVKALEDIYLYTVDDLAQVVQQGQANRQAAVAQAEVIIDAGVQSFMHWLGQRGTVPLIQQLNAQADEWRAAEMARARKLLAKGESVDAVLEAMSRGLTQKMMHGAMAELHAGDAASREQTAQTISRLFLRKER